MRFNKGVAHNEFASSKEIVSIESRFHNTAYCITDKYIMAKRMIELGCKTKAVKSVITRNEIVIVNCLIEISRDMK